MKEFQEKVAHVYLQLVESKWIILSLIIISIVYFALRFIHILSLPIFTDEAIYVRWSQIAAHDANWRFISLTDGKQPLFIWLTAALLKFVHDPLLAGRMISVFAGFGTVIGLFFLGSELFKNKWVGVISSLLYVIFPMALVYDRMALYDSLVGTFAIWGLYFVVLLVRYIRFDLALILGIVIGTGVLNKTNSFFTIDLLPFSLLIFNFETRTWLFNLFKYALFAFVAITISQVMYSVLRLSPFYHIIHEKDSIFVYTFSDWKTHPFAFFYGNLKGLTDWVVTYTTIPVILLAAVSFLVGWRRFLEKLLLVIWFLVPFVALALFGRTLYPRYVLFMILPLLPLIAYTIFIAFKRVRMKLLFYIFLLVAFFLQIRADYYILTDFANSPVPYSDLGQYVLNWPAGGGIKKSVAFFKSQAQKGPIFIGTEGTFGLLPYGLEIYLVDNPNITIKGYWPINKDIVPNELITKSKKEPTYMVFYQPCDGCKLPGDAPISWPVRLIEKVQKGNGSSFGVYQVHQ